MMPRNSLTKEEMKMRLLKLKNELYLDINHKKDKELTHKYLDKVFWILDEYRT
jgi:hypothetical protein